MTYLIRQRVRKWTKRVREKENALTSLYFQLDPGSLPTIKKKRDIRNFGGKSHFEEDKYHDSVLKQ